VLQSLQQAAEEWQAFDKCTTLARRHFAALSVSVVMGYSLSACSYTHKFLDIFRIQPLRLLHEDDALNRGNRNDRFKIAACLLSQTLFTVNSNIAPARAITW
jgi:hypothetical protein